MKKYTTLFYIYALLLVMATPIMAQEKSILDKKIAVSVYAKYNFYDMIRTKERDSEFYPSSIDPVIDVRYAIHPKIGIGFNFSPHLKTFQSQTAYYSGESDLTEEEQFDVNYTTYGVKLHYSLFKIPANYGPSAFIGFDNMNVDFKNLDPNKENLSRQYQVINLGFDDRRFFNSRIPLYVYYGLELNIHLKKYDRDEYFDEGFFETSLSCRTLFNGTLGIGYLL